MFGGDVDKTTGADVCTVADLTAGDVCAAGVPGTAAGHFYREEPGGEKSWSKDGSNSIAVGPDGTVYVGDYGRIQEFGPDGVFAGEFVLPLEGKEPQFVSALALDSAGDIYERSDILGEGTFASQIPGVREFSAAHVLLHIFDAEEASSEPTHIAIDESGDLFVSDYHDGPFSASHCSSTADYTGCPEEIFRAFKPNGALYAEFSSLQVQLHSSEVNPRNLGGIAVGGSVGPLYVSSELGEGREGAHIAAVTIPVPGSPAITEEHVSDLQPTTATLNAAVNPSQFDTEYRFEYTTTDFTSCATPANLGCHATATEDLGSVQRPDTVQAAISGLTPATAYHWRVVAESSAGTTAVENEFETLPDVSIRGFSTQTVGPELVSLKAELDPNNGTGTTYTIHYGLEAGSYSSGSSQGSFPAPSSEFKPVIATFSGLQPNTEYHYQLIAENSNGRVSSADQSFTTEPSAAEERAVESCPNTNLREENSSLALPDCRAYEQVSPVDKSAYPVNEANWLAPSGERDFFLATGSFAGSNQNRFAGYYVAHRTASGWVTSSPVGPPAGPEFQPSQPVSFDAELDTSLFLALPGSSSFASGQPGTGDWTLYLGRSDGSFSPASPPFSVPGGLETGFSFMGAGPSSALSPIVLATGYKLLPGDPRPDSPLRGLTPDRLYELNGAGGPDPTFSLAAEVPPGLPAGCALNRYFGQDTSALSTDGSTLFTIRRSKFTEAPVAWPLPPTRLSAPTHRPSSLVPVPRRRSRSPPPPPRNVTLPALVTPE